MDDVNGRAVTLVLVDGAGTVCGTLPPYPVATPWWQDATDVVAGARDRYGVEVAVLRMLSAQRPYPHGGAVTYLAECATCPTGVPRTPYDLSPHPLRAPWAQPGGPAASLAWAARELDALGWQPATTAQQRTWNLSAIWRLDSASGVAWLKQVPAFFAHEPAVLRWLATVAPDRVPVLLAAAEGRMLLAHIPGEDRYFAPPSELADLIDDLHSIQRVATVGPLLAAGVPDKRWPVLAHRIRATVAQYGGPALDRLEDTFAAIDACGLPDTLVHGDFHAGNTRSDGRRRTLIDWGDSSVGHPGFDVLRIVERQPPAEAAALCAHWATRWRETAPGSDPLRALDLLAPIATLSAAATYAAFVAAIEPSERPYHASDVRTLLDAVELR